MHNALYYITLTSRRMEGTLSVMGGVAGIGRCTLCVTRGRAGIGKSTFMLYIDTCSVINYANKKQKQKLKRGGPKRQI